MAIKLDYISAVCASYIINVKGCNYNALIGLKNANVKIKQVITDQAIYAHVVSQLVSYHQKYYA